MRLASLVALSLLVVAGCDENSTTPLTPDPGGSLTEGTWYVNEANGDTLPAKISERFIGVAQERIMLDSGRITVDGNGGWEERYFLSYFHTGVLDRQEVVLDRGLWSDQGPGYTFSSSVRARAFAATIPKTGEMLTVERMVFFESAPTASLLYRLTRP